MASFFGKEPDRGWLSLPPDYTPFGWAVRLIGAALGLSALTYLLLIQHRFKKQRRSRRIRRSFPSTLIKASLVISIVSITWEIALLAVVVAGVVIMAYGMFSQDS